MSSADKQYGLIEPKSGKKLTVSDVFNNDSDSGGEQNSKWGKKDFQTEEKGLKKQTKLEMQRTLQQDPTVYQYDEIYDEMTQKKQELEQNKVVPEKKAKYIHSLMKTAERRKKENERRLERQVQKEREAEGDMFKDKEEFITSSYKAKLEEFKKAEEEEKKMEYIESIMDVTKQQDLGGFYRHLYKETVVEPSLEDSKPNDNMEKVDIKTTEKDKLERNYRKRHNSDSADEKKTKEGSSSSSSDTDSSSDSSSSSTSSEEDQTEEKQSNTKQNGPKPSSEEGEIIEGNEKTKKEERSFKQTVKNGIHDTKSDSIKEERNRHSPRDSRGKEKDKREKNYRYERDRDRSINLRREDKVYRNRDRDRERLREREKRDDRKSGNRRDEGNRDSRRRKSTTPEKRRNRSRERSRERSRSKRDQEREKEAKDTKAEDKKKEAKEIRKEVEETKEKNETEVKISVWEKRTVGAAFEAAIERYRQRKAARGL